MDWIRVGTLNELEEKQCITVHGVDRPIAVFFNDGTPRAVDNRCPHMGFPLSRGSCENGIVTCHWHHARFDAASGCTFDLFADDVPPYDLQVRGSDVYVANQPRPVDMKAHARRRLKEGLRLNIPLICAKSILQLRSAKVDDSAAILETARFGAANRDSWASGMTILVAMANIVYWVGEETGYLALYQGARRVAADCEGQPPRVTLRELESKDISLDQLRQWMSLWTKVRHRDGAERTLLTAINNETIQLELAAMILENAVMRFYADEGHLLDFVNKAFELCDILSWAEAKYLLPTLMGPLTQARGKEESDSWHHPIDLVALVHKGTAAMPEAIKRGEGKPWSGEAQLAEKILGDDPSTIIDAILEAVSSGAQPGEVGKAIAYAAALRVARFATANELSDWITALHVFSHCNALQQSLMRCPRPQLMPATLHAAMAIYNERFLNVPAAPLPGEKDSLDHEETDPDKLLKAFLDSLDGQQQGMKAARLIARYCDLHHPIGPLFDTLVRAVVREDANFHTFQMVEAGIRQYLQWGDTKEGRNMMVGVARYLAAHSPTQRAQAQTAKIALRLHKGEDVYAE